MRHSTFLLECIARLTRGSQVCTVTPITGLVSLSQRLSGQSIAEAEVLRHGELYYIRFCQNLSIEVYWDTEVQGGGNDWREFSVGTYEFRPRPSWIVWVSKILILSAQFGFIKPRIFTTTTPVSLCFINLVSSRKLIFLYISLKSTTQHPFIPCTPLLHCPSLWPNLLSLPSAPSNLRHSLIPFPPFSHSLIPPASTYPPQKSYSSQVGPKISQNHITIPKEAISSKELGQTNLRMDGIFLSFRIFQHRILYN